MIAGLRPLTRSSLLEDELSHGAPVKILPWCWWTVSMSGNWRLSEVGPQSRHIM